MRLDAKKIHREICIASYKRLFKNEMGEKWNRRCWYFLGKQVTITSSNKALDLIQEVSVPQGFTCNMLACEVS